MKVTLEDYNNRQEEMIATSAAICYNSKPKNLGMINIMKEHKHLATFRFAFAVIKIEDISTITAVQTLRTSFADMLDSDSHLWESQRYVNQSEREFVVPECKYIEDDFDSAIVEATFIDINKHSKHSYNHLLSLGVKKEDARYSLTRAITTDLYIAGNMQMWSQFLKLRTDKHAQWEVRALANEIALVLSEKFPRIMEDFMDNC
jgi:thymidylate synthase (FAD)